MKRIALLVALVHLIACGNTVSVQKTKERRQLHGLDTSCKYLPGVLCSDRPQVCWGVEGKTGEYLCRRITRKEAVELAKAMTKECKWDAHVGSEVCELVPRRGVITVTPIDYEDPKAKGTAANELRR